MRFIDYIRLALHNIWRQKLRSALTIFAVVIGATSITIMLAAVFSLKGFITNQFEANGTFQQIQVSPQTDISWGNGYGGAGNCSGCTKLTNTLVSQISQLSHVTGVSRDIQVGGFQALTYGSQKYRLYGVSAYDTNGIQTTNLLAGRDIHSSDKAGVLTITSDYADKFGYKNKYAALVGKQVNLVTQGWYSGVGSDPIKQQAAQQAWFSAHPGQSGNTYSPPPITLTATIVGVVSTDHQSYSVRVPMAWARDMDKQQNYQPPMPGPCYRNVCQRTPGKLTVTDMVAQNGYDSLIVKVDQSSHAAAVATTIRHQFKVGAADAETEIKQQLAVFNILGYVLGGIGGIALVVAAVGVVNTMVMAILERTREIGVMRAVGARSATVSRLFTFEAALLGFFGGLIGLCIGYIAVLIANPIINHQLKGNGIKSSNIITLPLWLIIGVVGLTTVIGILAGLYPARRAARLDPVEALHYE